MAKRQKEWAKRTRAQLLALLGAICRRCGSREHLTFDCIIPTGPKHHRFDTSHRMSFYRSMHQIGNLQVLCHECNSRKGNFQRIGSAVLLSNLKQQHQSKTI